MPKKSLEFHIESNDYFGTLATVVSLVRQNIIDNEIKKSDVKILERLENDLMYLQKGYHIIKNS